ncbi:unnamed protein product [Trichogramma brassicae]|uniref:C2H2-type domain-containing protein n=1 Tax=Trichogramma brassicae TaxID=86971 RepID=A0A6H5IP32_9HYME|nr:unnamed protein product [Trichogramma brassicae]
MKSCRVPKTDFYSWISTTVTTLHGYVFEPLVKFTVTRLLSANSSIERGICVPVYFTNVLKKYYWICFSFTVTFAIIMLLSINTMNFFQVITVKFIVGMLSVIGYYLAFRAFRITRARIGDIFFVFSFVFFFLNKKKKTSFASSAYVSLSVYIILYTDRARVKERGQVSAAIVHALAVDLYNALAALWPLHIRHRASSAWRSRVELADTTTTYIYSIHVTRVKDVNFYLTPTFGYIYTRNIDNTQTFRPPQQQQNREIRGTHGELIYRILHASRAIIYTHIHYCVCTRIYDIDIYIEPGQNFVKVIGYCFLCENNGAGAARLVAAALLLACARYMWQIHQRTVHDGQKDFACGKCKTKFRCLSALIRHNKIVHDGRKDYECDKCDKVFGQKKLFLRHQKAVHEGRKDFACDKCELKFGHKHNLLLHQKTVHEGQKDYPCNKCEKKFGYKGSLLKHQKTVHEGRKDFACDKCEKKFGQKLHLLNHLKTVHENRKDFACDQCAKKFGSKRNLLIHHKTVHEGRKDYACDKCEKKFGQKPHLLNHLKTVHEGRKDFACDQCAKKFGCKRNLLLHHKTVHEGRKDYACHKCEKKFGRKHPLLRHFKTVHEGRKDYACDNCEKKFGHKSHLLLHQKTVHEGCKDYPCDKCEKKFGQKGHLLGHQKTVHEGRKDYACDNCEKKFGHKQHLLVHQMTVHGGRNKTTDATNITRESCASISIIPSSKATIINKSV